MADKVLLALDVGGTKTDAALFTPDGHMLSHRRFPGANPLEMGFDAACARYCEMADLTRQGMTPESVVIGIPALPYFGGRIEEFLGKNIRAGRVKAEQDGIEPVSSELGHIDGACLICGTGSSINIRRGEEISMIGGWGYLLDGCASGFVLGRRAYRAAVREKDGRGHPTLITKLIEERIGMDAAFHLPQLYDGGRAYFASFASTVFEARRMGDEVARQIFDDCVGDLSELVWASHKQLGDHTLVLAGGILQHFPEYEEALKGSSPAGVQMIFAQNPPLLGGAVDAMYYAGYECTEEFRHNFLTDYEKELTK